MGDIMKFLYPADTFSPKVVDEMYAEEYAAATAAGWPVALFNFEDFQSGTFRPFPKFDPDENILYRGWMLVGDDYMRLIESIGKCQATPHTSPEDYLLCHHLPRWYPLLSTWTAETRFFTETDNVADALAKDGWTGCFLKDYVKSLSTDGGSLVRDLSAIPDVVAKMKKYRGQIEGGLCARRIEDYDPESERRFLVYHGQAYADHEDVPEPVQVAAKVISSPFFTVDVAKTRAGELRIIELGDGQVSDRKHWSAEDFVAIFGTP